MTTRRSLLASALAVPALAMAPYANAQEATPAIRTEVGVVYRDVAGIRLLLDVYRPTVQEAPQPAMLVFYPGGFGAGDRSWMAVEAQALAEAGYVVFVPDYRLLDGVGGNLWPTQLDDAQSAVRWVRAHATSYGVDPDRIGAYGYSAGAQLAAQLGMRETRDNADPDLASYSSRVACAVDLAGNSDLTATSPNPGYDANFIDLFGGTSEELPDAYVDASLVSHIDRDTAPMLLLYGINDSLVPIEQGRRLADVLHEAMVEVVYAEIAGIDHLEWTWDQSGPWTLAFLERHLRG